jgi:Flp pilus assembly protein TadD
MTAAILLALSIAIPFSSPTLRERLLPAIGSASTFQAVDDEAASDQPSSDKQSGGFKKVVTAPVRLFARLFKGKDKEARQSQNLVASKPTEKQIENFKAASMIRTRDGVSGDGQAENNTSVVAANTERAAAAFLDEAIELHEKGQVDTAIEKLVAAIALRPGYADAYNLLAVCYDEKGQYRTAQEEYKRAVKLEPLNARFLNNLGYSYYLAGDYKDATKYYKKALKITPNDRRVHNNLGLAYGRKGDYARANEHFLIAVGEIGAHLNLGYIYGQAGRYEDAIKEYELALRSQPQSLAALSNLAQLYERTGRLREAAILNDRFKKLSVSTQQTAEQK